MALALRHTGPDMHTPQMISNRLVQPPHFGAKLRHHIGPVLTGNLSVELLLQNLAAVSGPRGGRWR
jgi:hypothetical protein